MPDYRVTWEIDITADTPREAAEQALAIQRRPGSSAVVFDVLEGGQEPVRIDLDEPDTSDIPEAGERFFSTAKLVLPDAAYDPEDRAELAFAALCRKPGGD